MPALEVNAGYGTDLTVLKVCTARLGRPCLLLTANPASGWQILSELTKLEWLPKFTESDIQIEQVSWLQAQTLARVWCEQHQALDWQHFVAPELARVLQKTPEMSAYIAYLEHNPVGMMLVMPNNAWCCDKNTQETFSNLLPFAVSGWWAGSRQVAHTLFNRAATDYGKLEVIVPTNWGLAGERLFICHASGEQTAEIDSHPKY
ncbi:MAG: hypothetical protein ACK41E_02420 [Deinococcales bacterium]